MANQTKWQPKLREIGQELKKKWVEYVIQIFIIFFSITISFSVDKWKDSLKRQETEQLYLKSLHENLQSDSLELTKTIKETQLVLDKGKYLLALIHTKDAAAINLTDFQAALNIIFKRPGFTGNDATFSELKSSGNMQALADFRLKNWLFIYYNHYEIIRKVELAEQQATIAIAGSYLIKRISLLPVDSTSAQAVVARKSDVFKMFQEAEFGNNLLLRLSNRRELLNDYQEELQNNIKLQSIIEKLMK